MLKIIVTTLRKIKERYKRLKIAMIKKLHWESYIEIFLIPLLLYWCFRSIPNEFDPNKIFEVPEKLSQFAEINVRYSLIIVFIILVCYYFLYKILYGYIFISYNVSFNKIISASIPIFVTILGVLYKEYLGYLLLFLIFFISIFIFIGSSGGIDPKIYKETVDWIATSLILADTEIKRLNLSTKISQILGGFSFIRKTVVSGKYDLIGRLLLRKLKDEEWIDLARSIESLEKEEDRIKMSKYISPRIFSGIYSIILELPGNFKGRISKIISLSTISITKTELKKNSDQFSLAFRFFLLHIIVFFEVFILLLFWYISPQSYSNFALTYFFGWIWMLNHISLIILLIIVCPKLFLYPCLIYKQGKISLNVIKLKVKKKKYFFEKMTIRDSTASTVHKGLLYYEDKATNNKTKNNKISLLYVLSIIIDFWRMKYSNFLFGNFTTLTFPVPMYKNVKMNISKIEKELDRYQNKESLSNEEIKEIAETIVKYSETTLSKVDNTFSVNIDKIISVFIQYLCLNYLNPSSRKKRCKIEFSDDIFPAFNEIWIREKKRIKERLQSIEGSREL